MLRVATFNIHNAYGDTRRAIGALIAKCEPDIVALQECSQSSADAICGHLGVGWRAHIATAAWSFSNAILSHLPLERIATLELRTPHAETRSATLTRLTLPSGAHIHACSTHLDHIDEDTRLAQWAQLHTEIPPDTVVCGDFNALRQADYTPERWANVTAVRQRNNWELPRTELLELMERQGYRDAALLAGGSTAGTCRYHTRIDYIFLGPGLESSAGPGSYQRHPARAQQLSDHDLLTVDLALS